MHTIKKIWALVRGFTVAHRWWSALIALVIVGGGWWFWSGANAANANARYVLGTVERGTIVSSVSESGQIASNQTLNITPQVSGQIIGLYVVPGETVHAGQAIATIDPTTAQQAVTTAKQNLKSAQLALQILQEPATTLTLTQQDNAITQAQQALATQYQSSFSDITSTFLDLPSIISSLQDIDLGNEAGGATQWNIDYYENQASKYSPLASQYRDAAYNSYETARDSYNQTFADFKNLSSTPDQATIEKMLSETYKTTGLIATAAKNSYDLIQFYSDQMTQNGATPKAVAATQISNLNTYQTKLQTHLTNLLSDTNSLTTDKNTITQDQQTLAQTQSGADPLSIQQDELNVQKAQDALTQAQQTLAQYYITAPFSGTIATVPVNKFDQAGSGTTIATLITPQQYADLSVNEVDAAKIQVGQKATLTFDAIPSLTLTGTVAQVDAVGTVSQGVVSYDVRVSLDSQNSQVKSGMTVNANIQTGVHQNTLIVPSSAVKTQGSQSYVLAFVPPIASSTVELAGSQGVDSATPPQEIPIQTGLTDDTNTEITSGLTQGQQIVIRTVSGSTAPAAAARPGGFGGGGFRGGGPIRIGG